MRGKAKVKERDRDRERIRQKENLELGFKQNVAEIGKKEKLKKRCDKNMKIVETSK